MSDTMESEMMGRSPSCSAGHLRHIQQYMSPTLRRLPMSTSVGQQQQFTTTKPLTPRNQSPFCTPNALHRKSVSRFHIFHPVNNTPPSRFPLKVQNPFEAALVDRLHLPLIGSPSLFHLPSTPQHSSTQFEWTIDEVSSLNPTNVEAHETQFISTIDPEQEAKAQEAITNYFKDKLSVPSPVDCPLRNQKIILPCSKLAARPTRNAFAQTELTLPPILPAELEDALRPFCTFTQDQQQTPTKQSIGANSTIDHEARDASLRRKLFDASLNSSESDGRDFQLEMDDCQSPAPTSPEIMRSATRNCQSPNDKRRSFSLSLSPVRSESGGHCSSFGSLSPITRAAQSPSAEYVSQKQTRISTNSSSIYQSTPGSSPPTAFLTCPSGESVVQQMSIDMSTQSVLSRVNRTAHPIRCLSKSFGSDLSAMLMDEEDHDVENLAPCSRSGSSLSGGSEMIIAGSPSASARSSSSSPDSQHSGTPSRKLRRANRKNLSHSFSSSQFLSDESMVEQEAALSSQPTNSITNNNKDCLAQLVNPNDQTETVSLLCQTDSGFNEMEE